MNLIFYQGSKRTVPNRSVPVPRQHKPPTTHRKEAKKGPGGWQWERVVLVLVGQSSLLLFIVFLVICTTEMSPALLNSFSMPPLVHSRALCISCRTWADTWTGCNGGQRTAAVQLAGLSLAVVWWDDGKKHPRLQKRLNGGRTKGNYGIIIIARHPLSNTLSQPPAIPARPLLLPL